MTGTEMTAFLFSESAGPILFIRNAGENVFRGILSILAGDQPR